MTAATVKKCEDIDESRHEAHDGSDSREMRSRIASESELFITPGAVASETRRTEGRKR
ncbi:hypothetical protein E4U36_000468 [Claviceps purpurea]|nr:hypothetical protein E4U36_000468 [Claviceps purpurea]